MVGEVIQRDPHAEHAQVRDDAPVAATSTVPGDLQQRQSRGAWSLGAGAGAGVSSCMA